MCRQLAETGYSGIIDALDALWKLTLDIAKEGSKFFYDLLNLDTAPWNIVKLMNVFAFSSSRLCFQIKDVSLIVLEAEYGISSEALSKTSVYLGEIVNRQLRLGLAARLSIKTVDAKAVTFTQTHRSSRHILSRWFDYYPTLLRLRRGPYKKMLVDPDLNEELKALICETYMDSDDLERLVSRDYKANLLAALPSVSIAGGLCLPVSFIGELKETLSRESVLIAEDRVVLKAYQAFNTVFDINPYPGHYLFLALIPITIPRTVFVLGNWKPEAFGEIKKQSRAVERFAHLFPTIDEISMKR